jgi:hypothetical protein
MIQRVDGPRFRDRAQNGPRFAVRPRAAKAGSPKPIETLQA